MIMMKFMMTYITVMNIVIYQGVYAIDCSSLNGTDQDDTPRISGKQMEDLKKSRKVMKIHLYGDDDDLCD